MKIPKELRAADYVSAINCVCGVLSIILSIKGDYIYAALLMVASFIADSLDGRFARRGRPTRFGKELDSLCDIVSFCVAPVVLYLHLIGINKLSIIICPLFVVSGTMRLARFNISKSKNYRGLPVTTNGIFVPILVFLGLGHLLVYYFALMSVLMVSSFKFRKF